MTMNSIKSVAFALFLLAPTTIATAEGSAPRSEVQGALTHKDAELPLSVRNIKISEDETGIHLVATRVNWLSSITFHKADGSPCDFIDAATGSSFFNLKFSSGSTLHVEPKMSRESTNLNVTFPSGRVRTFVLAPADGDVDVRTDVVMACQ